MNKIYTNVICKANFSREREDLCHLKTYHGFTQYYFLKIENSGYDQPKQMEKSGSVPKDTNNINVRFSPQTL